MIRDFNIQQRFLEIVNQKQPPVFWQIEAELFVPKILRRPLENIDHLVTIADYVSAVGPYQSFGVKISPVFYKRYIAPYKDDIQIVLHYKLTAELGQNLPNQESFSITYDAYLTDPIDLNMIGNIDNKNDEVTLDSGNLITVNFQLIDPMLNEMRLVEVGGVYRSTSLTNICLGLFAYGLRDNTDTEKLKRFNYPSVRGVEVTPATNTKNYKTVVIPIGTRLTKLARFLQQEYGIYGSGVNSYYQEGFWYVYPLYDTHRFDNAPCKLTLIIVPPDEAIGLEKSFIREGNHITILATGRVGSADLSESVTLNTGNAIRFNKASDLEQGMFTLDSNKAVGTGAQSNRAMGTEDRKKAIQNVRYTDGYYTDNPYKDLSKIASGQGQMLALTWEYSAPGFIRPGIPCRVMYQDKDIIQVRDGVVHGYRDELASATGRITDKTMIHNTRLLLFVDKVNKAS